MKTVRHAILFFRMTRGLARVLGLLAAGTAAAAGTTYTWTGSGSDGNWNTAANWSGAVPGANDTAKFNGASNGLAANATVLLGANQAVGTLNLSESNTNVTFGGDGGYSLTLTNLTGGSGNWPNIAAPIVLKGPGNFSWNAGWSTSIRIQQPISDGGNNYGLTLGNQTSSYYLYGRNTYGGTTVVNSMNMVLTGANGAITNSAVNICLRNSNGTTLTLDNTTAVNNDRLGDNQDILVSYLGGGFTDSGGSLGATEHVGTVWINSGLLQLKSITSAISYTNLVLWIAGVNRTPGTAMNLWFENTGHGSIGVNGATNVNGLWQPWALCGCDYPRQADFTKVDTNSGFLVPLAATDYAILPTSGADPNKVYQITNAAPVNLAASESVYALAGAAANNSNATLRLGNYDLTVASGAILGRWGGFPNISSTGGRLLFGGNELLLGVRWEALDSPAGATVATIDCPIQCLGSGTKNIVIGYMRPASGSNVTFRLVGADMNGTYGSIFCPWGNGNSWATIELGGSSNRTLTGSLNGMYSLIKSGSGTLTLSNVDNRVQYTYGSTLGYATTVTGGRLVWANNACLASAPVVTNAVLEVAAGATDSLGATLLYGSTLSGDGTMSVATAFTNGVHVAPGHAIGKLSISAATTFYSGANIDWEMGNATNTAGVDYDLLNITGNLALPASPATLTLNVTDSGNGSFNPKNATFTIAQYSGSCLTNSTVWNIVNNSPKTLDLSAATVTVNTNAAVKKILLAGVRRPSLATLLLLR